MFYGKENEDPHEHISNIIGIIDLFHLPGVARDQVMLIAFPFILKGKTKLWMKRLSNGSITAWDLFKSTFLDEYHPPLKIIKQIEAIRNFKQEPNKPLHCSWERFTESLFSCLEHKQNEHEQLQIFYQGLDAETRRKVDFKGSIPKMTPTKGIEAIKELSAYSLTWYKEGNVKSKNKELQVVLKQIDNFENNMNIITEEVRMAQHKYETPMEGRISNLEETLNNFIKESLIRQKESKNMVWGIKKSYDQTFKTQASSLRKIEYHSGKLLKIIKIGARSLPSSTKTNPRGLAHAITTRNELNYKPPKNPLEDMTNPQGKTAVKETMTKNIEEVPDDHRKTMESYDHFIPFPG
ncbi:integrase, catalytic region, zinc finger, CCHC-type containing protein [Tanacetum coccineum]|uniref:Integrase, catalytic region, zinc finger, CCHC-type containing protein n=1 Tax=Tanacetum coccineum TaxID=301880 RepID=A0ABQ4ZPV3_9ASTR